MDEGLKLEEVLERLCYYDERNPLCSWADTPEYRVEPRQIYCGCDNCHHGKDRLAMEILRLRALLESTRA